MQGKIYGGNNSWSTLYHWLHSTHLLLKGRTLTATFTEAMAIRNAWTLPRDVCVVPRSIFRHVFLSLARVTRTRCISRHCVDKTSSTGPAVLRNVVVVGPRAQRTSSSTQPRQTDDWLAGRCPRQKITSLRMRVHIGGSLISSDRSTFARLFVTTARMDAHRWERERCRK